MSVFRQTEAWWEVRQKRALDAHTACKPCQDTTRPTENAPSTLKSDSGGISKRKQPHRKTHRPSEHEEQAALIAWWDLWGTAHGYDKRLLFAIPNGEFRAWTSAKRLKAEGARPGVPDLLLAVDRFRVAAALFIEMKRLGGTAKKEQAAYHDLLRSRGYRVEVCKGFEAARDVIMDYLG